MSAPGRCLFLKTGQGRGAYVDSFIDSRVAAWSVGKVAVREVKTDNTGYGGQPFGFAACDIGLLTWQQGQARCLWRDGACVSPPGDTDDFVVENVV